MTTEEKAEIYALQNFAVGSADLPGITLDISGSLKRAYLAGAAEALRSQWISVKDRLPDHSRIVLAYISEKAEIAKDFSDWGIKEGILFTTAWCKDGEWEIVDDYYEDGEIDFWMELPPLPNTEEQ